MISPNRLSLLAIFLFLIVLNSCGKPSKEFNFEKDGVSFTCPANWKISDDEKLDETSYYLCCEKRGFDESGIFTLAWFNDSIGREQLLDIYRDELANNIIYEHAGLTFGSNYPGTYNTFETLSCEYRFTLLSIKHTGIMHCFYGCNKTFYIMIQEANEDKEKNAPGFQLLERNFHCN